MGSSAVTGTLQTWYLRPERGASVLSRIPVPRGQHEASLAFAERCRRAWAQKLIGKADRHCSLLHVSTSQLASAGFPRQLRWRLSSDAYLVRSTQLLQTSSSGRNGHRAADGCQWPVPKHQPHTREGGGGRRKSAGAADPVGGHPYSLWGL